MSDDGQVLLDTLYQFQQNGHLCDATLVSCEGHELKVHAGVLAAASPVLAQELAQCVRGHYTIQTSLPEEDIYTIIHSIYTGQKLDKELIQKSQLGLGNQSMSDGFTGFSSHADDRLSDDSISSEDHNQDSSLSYAIDIILRLCSFLEDGLYCDSTVYRENGESQLAHSYILAAKMPFFSSFIKTGSCVCIIGKGHFVNGEISSIYSSFLGFSLLDPTGLEMPPTLACKWCHQLFSQQKQLDEHEHLHVGQEKHTCKKCHEMFTTKEQLSWHKKTAHKKHYRCRTCGKKKQSAKSLQSHCMKHTKGKKQKLQLLFFCRKCGSQFTEEKHLADHLKICSYNRKIKEMDNNQSTEYKCLCGDRFTSESAMEWHKRRECLYGKPLKKRLAKPDRTYLCGLCGQSFSSNDAMYKHQQHHCSPKQRKVASEKSGTEDGGCICRQCGESFPVKADLDRHEQYDCDYTTPGPGSASNNDQLISAGEVSDKDHHCCVDCNADFMTPSQLSSHQRESCPIRLLNLIGNANQSQIFAGGIHCPLPQDQPLMVHKKISLPRGRPKGSTRKLPEDPEHLDASDLHCQHCKKVFKTKKMCTRHSQYTCKKRDWKGRHKCPFCGIGFNKGTDWKRHEEVLCSKNPNRTVEEVNPDGTGKGRGGKFQCNICLVRFTIEHNLIKHMRQTCRGFVKKRRQCKKCPQSFLTKAELDKHMSSHYVRPIYTCIHCNKQFERKFMLKEHREIYHPPYDSKAKIKGASRSISSISMVTNEAQYANEYVVVDKQTQDNSTKKIWECRWCFKEYDNKDKFERHLQHHNDEKPYRCPQCAKRFTREDSVRRHSLVVHNIPVAMGELTPECYRGGSSSESEVA